MEEADGNNNKTFLHIHYSKKNRNKILISVYQTTNFSKCLYYVYKGGLKMGPLDNLFINCALFPNWLSQLNGLPANKHCSKLEQFPEEWGSAQILHCEKLFKKWFSAK